MSLYNKLSDISEGALRKNMGNERRLMRDGVYARIRDEILACVLQPGSRIYENDLAKRYQVSKSPVRDALLRLQEKDLIEVLPRKGYRVRPISVSDARELYEMRLLLERASTEYAAEHATEDELASLDRFRTADENMTLLSWVKYNSEFHRSIAAIAHNSRLVRATQEVIDQFDRLTFVSVSSAEFDITKGKFAGEHGDIIDAVQTRNKRRAGSLVSKHIKNSQKRLMAAFDDLPITP
ncbi:MAG: GntR family transcriptional regulator [Rhodospirillales bacterium]|jgi:DNA-binding GntR family transcriptional regulator|nr:GntR family transcriptional regulator [Rhodospirillales bacterium]